jgi:hypothetical protein
MTLKIFICLKLGKFMQIENNTIIAKIKGVLHLSASHQVSKAYQEFIPNSSVIEISKASFIAELKKELSVSDKKAGLIFNFLDSRDGKKDGIYQPAVVRRDGSQYILTGSLQLEDEYANVSAIIYRKFFKK